MLPSRNCHIAGDAWIGKGFQCGYNCIIEGDVVIGDNAKFGHNVLLKSGTRIGDNVELADGVCTTGYCIIGNNVMVRTHSVISKGVILNDWVFVGGAIMSSHTRHVYHGRPQMVKRQYVTRVGYGAVIGSKSNLTAGVWVAPGVVVGYASNVVGELPNPHGLYHGNPARFHAWLYSDWQIKVPDDYIDCKFDPELLKKYLPFVRGIR